MNDRLIKDIKKELNKKLSIIIEKIILFGSQIKPNPSADSDFDILIIIKEKYDWILEDKIIDICFDVGLKHNAVVDIKIISSQELNTLRGRQPYIQNALKNGIAV